jgi:hypothetical protein
MLTDSFPGHVLHDVITDNAPNFELVWRRKDSFDTPSAPQGEALAEKAAPSGCAGSLVPVSNLWLVGAKDPALAYRSSGRSRTVSRTDLHSRAWAKSLHYQPARHSSKGKRASPMSELSESLRAKRPVKVTRAYLHEMRVVATVAQERMTAATKSKLDPNLGALSKTYGISMAPQTDKERSNWAELFEAAQVEIAWAHNQLGRGSTARSQARIHGSG